MKLMKNTNRKGFALLPIVILGAAAIIAAGIFFGFKSRPQITVQSAAATPQVSFGAAGSPAVQAQPFSLQGSGVTAIATSFSLTSFKLSDNQTPITMSMFGSGGVGYGVFEPGSSREENVSFTSVTQNADGSAVLGGVTRGLTFSYPCVSTSTLQKAHAGGTKFVLSNSNCFYQNFLTQQNDASITAQYEFSKAPTIDTPSTNASSAATYGQLASTSFAGTVNASLVQKGIVQEATQAQMAAGTVSGSTGADLVQSNRFNSLTASTSPVNVVASGTIDPSYLLNGNYNFNSISSASTTLNGTTSIPYLIPVGTLEMYASSSAPNGWLLANGQAISRATYATLFNLIGTSYGSGDGSTTFNVPDFRDRLALGQGQGTYTQNVASSSISGSTLTVTANNSIYTGTALTVTETSGSLPAPLATGTTYYAISTGGTTIQLATTTINATNGSNIPLTNTGSSTMTLALVFSNQTVGSTGGQETHVQNQNEVAHISPTSDSNSGGGAPASGNALAHNGQSGGLPLNSFGNSVAMPILNPYTVINFIIKF